MNAIEKLLVAQEHDCRIREMEKEMRDIPARKKEEESLLKEHREALTVAQENVKAKQVEIKKIEIESNASREKITKLRQQQLQIKTNKEFKALETEINNIKNEISSFEDQELVLMEEMEKLKAETDAKRRSLAEEEAVVQSDLRTLDERLGVIKSELRERKAARESAVKEIQPEWLKRYERIFEHKDKAVVPLGGGVCGGCHMKLPAYVSHDTKKNSAMVICGFCGRILY